jgi:hypothetical protein
MGHYFAQSMAKARQSAARYSRFTRPNFRLGFENEEST